MRHETRLGVGKPGLIRGAGWLIMPFTDRVSLETCCKGEDMEHGSLPSAKTPTDGDGAWSVNGAR